MNVVRSIIVQIIIRITIKSGYIFLRMYAPNMEDRNNS